jgi:prepilin-type N-terminal cleavage/methylation domain-containing protein
MSPWMDWMTLMKSLRHSVRGFTLVETIVALGILAFGVMGIYSQFLETHRQSADRVTIIQARLLAHQELERLRACSFESLKAESLKAGLPATPQDVRGYLRYIYQAKLTPLDSGVIQIEVRVGWDTTPITGFIPGKSVLAKGYSAP